MTVHDTPLYTGIDDLVDVKRALKNVNDWQSLGLQLGLLYPTLERIEVEHRGAIERCKTKMIVSWLQQQDNVTRIGVPSWSVLRAALRKIGENEIARNIGEFAYNKIGVESHSILVHVD